MDTYMDKVEETDTEMDMFMDIDSVGATITSTTDSLENEWRWNEDNIGLTG